MEQLRARLALRMPVPSYSLGQELLYAVQIYGLHLKVVAVLLHHSCVCWVSHKRREYSMYTANSCRVNQMRMLFWPLHQPGERLGWVTLCHGCCCACCISRENKCVCRSYGSLSLLPASQLTPCTPVSSANSVKSQTTGAVRRMKSDTILKIKIDNLFSIENAQSSRCYCSGH